MTQVPAWRKITAGVAGIVGATALIVMVGSAVWVAGIGIVGLFVAAGLIHVQSLGAQLLSRAVWWSSLALGAILCLDGGSSERRPGILLAIGCGMALLVIGRKGLAETSERASYAPAAFRSSLLLLMVLALADAQTFALLCLVEMKDWQFSGVRTLILGVMTIGFVVGFLGLYRIKLWGAVLNAVLALIMFVVAATGVFGFKDILRTFVLAVTGLQVVCALPLFAGLFTSLRLPQTSARLRSGGAAVTVVMLMLFSVAQFIAHGGW